MSQRRRMRRQSAGKACGHWQHPEDGNVQHVKENELPRVERGADVEAHRSDPAYFVGRYVKLRFEAEDEHEYMWIEVHTLDTLEGVPALRGRVDNIPGKRAVKRTVSFNDEVTFTTDEIIDVADVDAGPWRNRRTRPRQRRAG